MHGGLHWFSPPRSAPSTPVWCQRVPTVLCPQARTVASTSPASWSWPTTPRRRRRATGPSTAKTQRSDSPAAKYEARPWPFDQLLCCSAGAACGAFWPVGATGCTVLLALLSALSATVNCTFHAP